MLALAVRHDALKSNPVVAIKGNSKKASRASTAIPLDGVSDFRRVIRGGELERLDVIDLLEFMLFTGCRIGEASALRWTHVDLKSRTVTFSATVGHVTGQGLILQEHGKTDSSSRTVRVPDEVNALLVARQNRWLLSANLVFPSMQGKLRDTSNT